MAKRGQAKRKAMLERLERYAELRGQGVNPLDAGKQLGVGRETSYAYERWYRRERLGYPDRRQGDYMPAGSLSFFDQGRRKA